MLTDNGVFTSFSRAFRVQFSSKFWTYIGVTVVLYIIMQVVSLFFTLVPSILMGTSMVVSYETIGNFGLINVVIYIIAIVVGFILGNILSVGMALMYYDSREDLHRMKAFSQINQIGEK